MPDENTTILILKGVKRVKSIKVNRKRIRVAIYSVSIFAGIFLISIGLNIYQFMNPGFFDQVIQGEAANIDNESGSVTANKSAIPENDPTLTGKDVEQINGTSEPERSEPNAVTTSGNIFANDIVSDEIGLENWGQSLSISGNELDVSFQIYKKGNSSGFVSGTIIIIAKTTDSGYPFLSFPDVVVAKDGTVPNYFRGEFFSMSVRTPPKTGKLTLPNRNESFEYYHILVYSDNGELLLRQTRSLSSN